MSEELYQKALSLVPQFETINVSTIQRVFRISYQLSCEIVSRMIEEGVIPEPPPPF